MCSRQTDPNCSVQTEQSEPVVCCWSTVWRSIISSWWRNSGVWSNLRYLAAAAQSPFGSKPWANRGLRTSSSLPPTSSHGEMGNKGFRDPLRSLSIFVHIVSTSVKKETKKREVCTHTVAQPFCLIVSRECEVINTWLGSMREQVTCSGLRAWRSFSPPEPNSSIHHLREPVHSKPHLWTPDTNQRRVFYWGVSSVTVSPISSWKCGAKLHEWKAQSVTV